MERAGIAASDNSLAETPATAITMTSTATKKKKKKTKKKSAGASAGAAVGQNGVDNSSLGLNTSSKSKSTKSGDGGNMKGLCIARNKHWKYISSYHVSIGYSIFSFPPFRFPPSVIMYVHELGDRLFFSLPDAVLF